MKEVVAQPMRAVIVGTLVACLGVAVAPWFSGGQEPVAMLVSAGALLLGALLVWRQPEVRTLRYGPLVWSFGALMVVALLSLLWSANRYSTAMWITQWIMAGLVFRLAYVLAAEDRGREWMLRLYLVSAGVFSVVAVWMYLITASFDRLTGTFYWPNPAAAYLMPAILLCVDRLRRSAGRWAVGWALATAGFMTTFLLTDSRGATLVLGILLIVYCFVSATNKKFWTLFVFSLAIGFALSLSFVKLSTLVVRHSVKAVPGSRIAQVAVGESQSLNDRIQYLDSAFEIWFNQPLGGTGAGTYGDVHPQYQGRVVSASANAHNVYVQTLAELGLAGALAMAALVLWLLAGMLRGLIWHPELLAVALGAIVLLVHAGLDIDAQYPALLMLAALLLGFVYQQGQAARRAASWRLAALATMVLVPAVSLYQSGVWAARGQSAQTNGDYPEAAVDFAAAHRGLVFNPDYVNAEGIDYYTVAAGGGPQAGRATTFALDRAREAEKLDPHDGQHHQLEGRVLTLEHRWPAAESAFRTALKLDPYDHPQYSLDLASVQVAAGDPSGAAKTAKAMLALYPPDVVDIRSADPTVRPAVAGLEVLVGNLALRQGDVAAAAAAARRAAQVNPGDLGAQALAHQVNLLTAPAH